jgi:hypothetical protein
MIHVAQSRNVHYRLHQRSALDYILRLFNPIYATHPIYSVYVCVCIYYGCRKNSLYAFHVSSVTVKCFVHLSLI